MSSAGRKMKARMSWLPLKVLKIELSVLRNAWPMEKLGRSGLQIWDSSFWLLASDFWIHSPVLFCLNPRLLSQCGDVGCYDLLPDCPPILSQHLLAYGLKGRNRRWLAGVKEQHVITRS